MSDQHQTDQKEAEQLFRSHSPSSLRGQQLRVTIGYNLFAIGAFLMSLFFLVDVWVGGLTTYQQWDTVKWVMFAVAMVVTAALTMGQHATYDSGLSSNLFTWAKAAVIAFALFSEISQTMERENSGAQQRGMDTEEYKTATGTASLPSISTAATVMAPAYVQDAQREKAAAMVELGRCDRHASKGAARVEKCRTFEQTRIDEAQAIITGYKEDREIAAKALQTTSVAMLDKAKEIRTSEDNHKSMIRFISELLGVKSIFGAFLFAVLIIAPFELMFYSMGVLKHRIAIALKMYGLNTSGKSLRDEYTAYGIGSPAPANAAAPASALVGVAQAVKQAVQTAPQAIGDELMKAQGARNALNLKLQEQAGKVGDTLDTAAVRYSGGFRQSPQQRANAESLAQGELAGLVGKLSKPDKVYSEPVPATGTTYRQELYSGSSQFRDVPLDRPTPAVPIRVSEPSPACTSTRVSSVLVHGETDDPDTPVQPEIASGKKGREFTDELYEQLKSLIITQEIKPTFRPIKAKLKVWLVGGNDNNRQIIAGAALDRMAGEGVLIQNPDSDGGMNKAKYILA